MRAWALLVVPFLWACSIPEHSPMMNPGEDCLACHGANSGRHWYAAGTVYADAQAKAGDGIQGAVVVITDANHRTISLSTNGAGNFYTAETLVFPAKVEVRRNGKVNQMPTDVPQGGCNSCHTTEDTGRIVAP
jgi:hypothetical protein